MQNQQGTDNCWGCSVRAVMMAATEELVLVNGIGKKTAAAMRSILDGPAGAPAQKAVAVD